MKSKFIVGLAAGWLLAVAASVLADGGHYYDGAGAASGFASPATEALDMNGFDITLDADGNSLLDIADNSLEVTLGTFDYLTLGGSDQFVANQGQIVLGAVGGDEIIQGAPHVAAETIGIKAGGSYMVKMTESAAGEAQQEWTACTFGNLGTPTNGRICYCSDCTFANPCAGAGTGAFAKRLNGAWRCD